MKTKFTTRSVKAFTLMLVCFFITNTTFAQTPPMNDNVCMAMNVTLGPTGVFMVVDTATVEPGENAISPPLGDCTNGWCDNLGIESSVWFTFTAPASGAVNISLCGSSYDSQLALYEVGTCSDFNSFTYVFGNDDTPDGAPGQECGPADPNTPGYGLASEFDIWCLTPGQVYYVVVDTWLGAGDPEPSGKILDLKINEVTAPPPTAAITTVTPTDPLCPGGMDGTATIEYDGVEPVTISWSNGQTGVTASGLAAGTYTVNITDFCGATAMQTVTIMPGQPPVAPTIGAVTILPADCGADGAAAVEVVTGTPPFTWLWSTGSTDHQPALPAGTHSVTITDGCGTSTVTQSVTIPGGTDVTNQNFMTDLSNGCSVSLAGVVNSVAPMEDNSVTYNVDQTLDGNIACRGGGFISDNGFWRAYDLATDFSVSGPYLLGEVELGIFSALANNGEGHQPIEIRIYHTNNMDLSVATNTLVKTVVWTVADRASSAAGFIYVPIDYEVPAGQLIAVEVWNPDGTAPLNRQLGIAANTSPGLNGSETFISSTGCGITTPTPMSVIGFPHQTVFNLVEYTYDVTWTPATYLDDATALEPVLTANPSSDPTLTYTVTVVDGCGSTQMGTAVVDMGDCWTSSNEAIVDASFSITPNPSDGFFNIQNDGTAREMTLEVFDLSGKNLVSTVINLGQGDVTGLDLSAVPSGMYIAKLTDGDQAEIHKLVVE